MGLSGSRAGDQEKKMNLYLAFLKSHDYIAEDI